MALFVFILFSLVSVWCQAEGAADADREAWQRAYIQGLQQQADERQQQLERERRRAEEQGLQSGQPPEEAPTSPEDLTRQRHALEQLELEREQEAKQTERKRLEQEAQKKNQQKRYDSNGNGWLI